MISHRQKIAEQLQSLTPKNYTDQDLKKIIRRCSRELKTNHDTVTWLWLRGMSKLYLRRTTSALKDLLRVAITTDDLARNAWFYIGETLVRQKKYLHAIGPLLHAQRLGYNPRSVGKNIARALTALS